MTLQELTAEQRGQLKIRFLDDLLMKTENRNISYGEMANIDEIVADDDEEFIAEYSAYIFTEDDFF